MDLRSSPSIQILECLTCNSGTSESSTKSSRILCSRFVTLEIEERNLLGQSMSINNESLQMGSSRISSAQCSTSATALVALTHPRLNVPTANLSNCSHRLGRSL